MQDLRTGEMKELSGEILKQLEQLKPLERRLKLQEACDGAEPDRSRHGPIFQVGEILEIRGGKFKVHAIDRNGITLHGVPSI